MYNFLRKSMLFVLIAVFLISAAGYSITAQAADSFLDKSELEKGIVTVNYKTDAKSLAKVRVIKKSTQYIYDLKDGMRLPLQSGNGSYTIEILLNVEGNKYRKAAEETVEYITDNGKSIYLQSNAVVNWQSDMKAVAKAEKLTENAKTDSEKVLAVYNYIVKNVKYDTKKARTVEAGYIPSVNDIFKTNLGICYDYSVLFASMLRSVGVPVKVLMGTSSDVTEYHSWNQVYLSDKKSWILVDTTLDAGTAAKTISALSKDAGHYSADRQY